MDGLQDHSIEELVAAYVSTDEERYYIALSNRLMPLMNRMACDYKNRWFDQDDLLQEYRLQLHQSAHAYKEEKKACFLSYYQKSIQNLTINIHRSMQADKRVNDQKLLSLERSMAMSGGGLVIELKFIHTNQPVSPEEGIHIKQCMRKYLEHLSEREAQFFKLYLKGKKMEQIAKKMNMQVKSMHDMRYRCMIKMKKCYGLLKGEKI